MATEPPPNRFLRLGGLAVDLFGLNAAISGGADTESNQEGSGQHLLGISEHLHSDKIEPKKPLDQS